VYYTVVLDYIMVVHYFTMMVMCIDVHYFTMVAFQTPVHCCNVVVDETVVWDYTVVVTHCYTANSMQFFLLYVHLAPSMYLKSSLSSSPKF